MQLSVIIPTFNEEENIAGLLDFLYDHKDQRLLEIMVADGKSTDHTVEVAKQSGARVVRCPLPGRAAQMNYAASLAQGDVLYFVHADTLPPDSYLDDIAEGLNDGFLLGSYCSNFQSDNPVFRINAWFTRFSSSYSYGGDQTLYVYRDLFDRLEGFHEKYVIMEDFDFVKRARRIASFKKIPKKALISTRKYDKNSFVRVSLANLIVFSMYRLGVSPRVLKKVYQKLLRPAATKKSSEVSSS